MLAVFGQIPINDVLVGRITTSAWRSRVYSLRYIVNFTVMASTVPIIAGIHAYRGFGMLFLVMSAAAACILCAALALPRTGSVAFSRRAPDCRPLRLRRSLAQVFKRCP